MQLPKQQRANQSGNAAALAMMLLKNAVPVHTIALYCIVWSLAIVATWAQKFYMGECPIFDPIHNFEINRYMGVWYQIASTRGILKENPDCVEHRYSAGKNGSFHVLTKFVSTATNGPTKSWGIAKPYQYHGLPLNSDYELTIYGDTIGHKEVSQYFVLDTDYDTYSIVWGCRQYSSYLIYNGHAENITTPYAILSTDYCNYSIVWACTENIFFNIHTVEVLSRERNPDFATILSKTFEVLIRAELDFLFDYLYLTRQFMCVVIPPIPASIQPPFIMQSSTSHV